jgi:hypothetical protein
VLETLLNINNGQRGSTPKIRDAVMADGSVERQGAQTGKIARRNSFKATW